MKTLLAALFMCLVCFTAEAAEKPSCVFMKFTDDTRFVKVESAASLSDLVMEKLVASGKFNFKETKVIDEDMEKLLYEERAAEFKNASTALSVGDFDILFERQGFSENFAQTIATARLGQFVAPEITSQIGKRHGADYLIQGTILNIGTGVWTNPDIERAKMYAGQALQFASMTGAALGQAAAVLGPVGAIIGSLSQDVATFGIQADLKVIKASTGEVVWQKTVMGKKTKKQTNIGFGYIKAHFGSDKIDNEMHAEAMDNAVQLISDTLIEEASSGKLFIK